MPYQRRRRLSLWGWLGLLFRQPPREAYRLPSVYLSGGRMEIEHFRTILFYEEDRLTVQLPRGVFTVYGSGLRIETLTAGRITLRGTFLRTDFSSE